MFISKEVLHQTLACLSVFWIQFLIGLAYGWIPISLKKLQDDNDSVLPLTSDQASWMVSVSELGKISGPMFAPFIIDNFGRRPTMLLVMYMLSLMWPSVFFARNIYLIYVIRFLFGSVHGLFDVLSSIYITENCSSEIRIVLGSILTIVFTGGISTGTVVTTCLSYEHTALVNGVIAICAFSSIYFCTETPYFLVMKKRYDEAEKKVVWLLGMRSKDGCSEKIKEIEANARVNNEKQNSNTFKVLLSSAANVKSIAIVLSMHVISMMTGSSAVAPYSSMIFSSSETVSANQYVIMYGTCILMSACLSPFVVMKLNRRILLIVSFTIISLTHVGSTLLIYFHNRGYEIVYYPWLLFGCVASYGMVRQMFGPAVYIIRAEILPMSVRAIGGSMTVIASAITGFVMARTFLPVATHFGLEINFLIYASMSSLMAILIYYFLPESRGKSLEEIQKQLAMKIIRKDPHNFAETTPESRESRLHTLFR